MDHSHPHLYQVHQISLVLSARKSYLAQTVNSHIIFPQVLDPVGS